MMDYEGEREEGEGEEERRRADKTDRQRGAMKKKGKLEEDN